MSLCKFSADVRRSTSNLISITASAAQPHLSHPSTPLQPTRDVRAAGDPRAPSRVIRPSPRSPIATSAFQGLVPHTGFDSSDAMQLFASIHRRQLNYQELHTYKTPLYKTPLDELTWPQLCRGGHRVNMPQMWTYAWCGSSCPPSWAGAVTS